MDVLFPLGWRPYLAGGLLIGAGVALLFLATGLVGGMSTVFSSTWSFVAKGAGFRQPRLLDGRIWRLVYAAGLVAGAAAWWLWAGGGSRLAIDVPAWRLLLGGLLVGFGARLANGCTSGHGICGLGSLQWPSLAAVAVFMTTAFATVALVGTLGGGTP